MRSVKSGRTSGPRTACTSPGTTSFEFTRLCASRPPWKRESPRRCGRWRTCWRRIRASVPRSHCPNKKIICLNPVNDLAEFHPKLLDLPCHFQIGKRPCAPRLAACTAGGQYGYQDVPQSHGSKSIVSLGWCTDRATCCHLNYAQNCTQSAFRALAPRG